MDAIRSRARAASLCAVATTVVIAAAVFATRALPAHAAATGAPLEVAIAKFAFAPRDITVAPGTKVVWTNRDETPHSVASADKSFASKGMDTDDTYEHTFDREGDFSYICTVHPFMTGVVHVRKP